MLAFVVGRAAPVDALVFDDDRPRRKALAPEIVETAYGVAVAVDQHRDEFRIFDALGDEQRRTGSGRIVEHAAGEAEGLKRRHHLVVEIAAQRRGALRLLARLGMATRRRKLGEERAVVEMSVGTGDGGGAGHSCVQSLPRQLGFDQSRPVARADRQDIIVEVVARVVQNGRLRPARADPDIAARHACDMNAKSSEPIVGLGS